MIQGGYLTQMHASAATWANDDPVVPVAVLGVEDDTGRFKIGDGEATWNALAYAVPSSRPTYLGTSIVAGGQLSVNPMDNTKFDVSEAVLVAYDDFADPLNSSQRIITVPASTGVAVSAITDQLVTYVSLSTNGVIIQHAEPLSNQQRRQAVSLGLIVHSNKTTINGVDSGQQVGNSLLSQLYDLFDAIGPIRRNGLVFSPAGANLSLSMSSGSMFKAGASLDPFAPHLVSLPAQSLVTFRYRDRLNEFTANRTTLDPTRWDNGGVLTTVNVAQFTVQRISLFASGEVRVQYGQRVYSTLDDAVSGAWQDPYSPEDNLAENSILRALVVLKGNATSLQSSAARILHAPSIVGSRR